MDPDDGDELFQLFNFSMKCNNDTNDDDPTDLLCGKFDFGPTKVCEARKSDNHDLAGPRNDYVKQDKSRSSWPWEPPSITWVG